MKRVRVRVTPPESERLPVQRAICSTEELGEVALLSGGTDADDPTELFSVRGPEATVRSALADQPGVRSVEVLAAEDGETYVHVRERGGGRTIASVLTRGTLVVTLPIHFRTDGGVELTVLGSGADLQAALDAVRDLAELTVLRVRDGWSESGGDALTDRQREVLRAALDAGYYDSPRMTTQQAVAARLDIAASTVAEHLRSAEAALVADALGSPDADAD